MTNHVNCINFSTCQIQKLMQFGKNRESKG
jgi:hypothetical protein